MKTGGRVSGVEMRVSEFAGHARVTKPDGVEVAVDCAKAVEAAAAHKAATVRWRRVEGFIGVVFMRNVVG